MTHSHLWSIALLSKALYKVLFTHSCTHAHTIAIWGSVSCVSRRRWGSNQWSGDEPLYLLSHSPMSGTHPGHLTPFGCASSQAAWMAWIEPAHTHTHSSAWRRAGLKFQATWQVYSASSWCLSCIYGNGWAKNHYLTSTCMMSHVTVVSFIWGRISETKIFLWQPHSSRFTP